VIEGLQRLVHLDAAGKIVAQTRVPFVRYRVECDKGACFSQRLCLDKTPQVAQFDTLGFATMQEFRFYLMGTHDAYNRAHPEQAALGPPRHIGAVLMSAFAGNKAAQMLLMDLYSRPVRNEMAGRMDFEHEFTGALRDSIREAYGPFRRFIMMNDCQR
jgi:hypothetical protein